MRADAGVCGTAQSDVGLVDMPLQGYIVGGNRSVGNADALTLSACETSVDPDEPTARCILKACGTLRFEWRCSPVDQARSGCDGVPPPSTTSCEWRVAALSLPSDRQYLFTLTVSKTSGGDLVSSAVLITVTAGAVPTVGIIAPSEPKLNPSSKLMLRGRAAMVMADASSSSTAASLLASSFSYRWRLYEGLSTERDKTSTLTRRPHPHP